MNRRDWTLLALSAANGEPLTPVQLQKVMFLLGRSFPEAVGASYYKFSPYHYGPFDAAVYRDANGMAEQGLVVLRSVEGQRWQLYAATPKGLRQAEALRSQAPQAAVDYLRRAVEWARRLSFQQIVRAIYEAYPEMRTKSVFVG